MASSAALLARLGIVQPILQAPMAGVSTPQLAAAVSNAGGLGALGIGASAHQQARQMIHATFALTARPFHVNVFCHAPAERDAAREAVWLHYLAPLFAEVGLSVPAQLNEIYPSFNRDAAMCEMLLELRPKVVSFHFGLPPREWITAMRTRGIVTLATATNLHEAQLIEQAGVDAIVAQGIEAGGHRGMFDPAAPDDKLSTDALLRQLLQQSKLPIIAAGGIMNGAGIKAALDAGAAAVQLGTAFILCPESAANAGYREKLQREHVTQLTDVISGRPARGLINRLIEFGEAAGHPPPANYPVAYDAAKQLHAAAMQQGSHEFAAHWAGQNAALARALPAGALLKELVEEWQRLSAPENKLKPTP